MLSAHVHRAAVARREAALHQRIGEAAANAAAAMAVLQNLERAGDGENVVYRVEVGRFVERSPTLDQNDLPLCL